MPARKPATEETTTTDEAPRVLNGPGGPAEPGTVELFIHDPSLQPAPRAETQDGDV